MRKKAIVFIVVFIFLVPLITQAKAVYSTISTSFQIQKRTNCDRLAMKFRIWAEGNTFSDALKRLKPLNNEFLSFLASIYPKEQVRSQVNFSGIKEAVAYVEVNTDKIKSAQKIFEYILKKKFPYQTGINIEELRYFLSNQKANKIKSEIFKEALVRCKQLLKIINTSLHKNYNISSINISFGKPRAIYNELRPRILFKAISKSEKETGIQTSSGQRIIIATVSFSAISKIE